MKHQTGDTAAIAACIRSCSQARDGRGQWRHVQRLASTLQRPGHSSTVAEMTAAAAGRIGAWLGMQHGPEKTPCRVFDVTRLVDTDVQLVCDRSGQPVVNATCSACAVEARSPE